MRRLVLIGFGSFAVAWLAIGCGMVTGLSNDYNFLAEGGSDGASGDAPHTDGAGDGGPDGGKGGGCSPMQTTNASDIIAGNMGDKLPMPCAACLAQSCCTPIAQCDNAAACKNTMSCVFGCYRANVQSRQMCVMTMCPGIDAFMAVSSCDVDACDGPCGPLK
jgi:hypothetical protein